MPLFMLILFLLSALFCGIYIFYAHKLRWLDVPNHRSAHTISTPRGGGVVFVGLWLLSIIFAYSLQLIPFHFLLTLLPGTLLVALVGFLDDRYSLSAKYRALAYSIAALLSAYFLGGLPHIIVTQHSILPLGSMGFLFAVIAILWSTNLFNFMDGMDGVAAVEALFVLGLGGVFLFISGGTQLALLAFLLAASVAGFLIWNRPRAKLFMGDAGSASLGFVIMIMAILGEQHYQVPILVWMILYAAFWFDTTITLIRRIRRGEKWYESHCSHAYQRLHQAGWSHKRVLVGLVLVNCILSILAIGAFIYQNLMILMLLLSIIMLWIVYRKIDKIYPMTSNSTVKSR